MVEPRGSLVSEERIDDTPVICTASFSVSHRNLDGTTNVVGFTNSAENYVFFFTQLLVTSAVFQQTVAGSSKNTISSNSFCDNRLTNDYKSLFVQFDRIIHFCCVLEGICHQWFSHYDSIPADR